MMTKLKAALVAAAVGAGVLLQGTAVANAEPFATGPGARCKAAEADLCTAPTIKAKPPRGYKTPKIPRGY